MKKKGYLLFGAVLLVVSLLVFGCTVVEAPEAEAPEAEAPEVVRLQHSHFYMPADPTTDYYDPQVWYMDEVEKRTEGRVVFDRMWGGSLTAPGESGAQLKSGLIDFTVISSLFVPGEMPLFEIDGASVFSPADTRVANLVKWQLYEEFPELRAEIEQYNAVGLFVGGAGSYQIIANRPLATLEDYKGLKVGVVGRFMPRWYSSIGAIPITMPFIERWGALQTGILDASCLFPVYHYMYNFHELCKYHGMPNFGDQATGITIIRKEMWDKISPRDQEIMRQVAMEAMEQYSVAYANQSNAEAIEALKAAGVTFYDYTDQQRTEWAQAIPNFGQEWVDEARNAEERNVRIRLWQRRWELIEEYGYEWPMDWWDVK